jgi:hypothetical protein
MAAVAPSIATAIISAVSALISQAFRKQLSLLESKNDMVAHLAARDIMDRAGFSPVDKIDLKADVDTELHITIDYGDDDEGSGEK